MKCEEVRDEMIAYLKGELDEARKNEIDEHLARCQGCRRELESSQKILHRTQSANEANIVSLTDEIIEKAVHANASDIHLDPSHDGADVLYRVDGVLHTIQRLSKPERDAVTARIRQMAGLPLAEVRTLQDGRVGVTVGDRGYDLRLAVMPVLFGEKVVMRIFDHGEPLLGLDKMGFSEEQMSTVQHLLHQPNGMVVATGPIGSGKTTLLYSMVMEVTNPRVSVVTIEDPIEYQLPGVQQAQVSPRNDFTFATALRGYLRQDPDVIMVGAIRDLETGEITVEAAVTGHFVLAPLHTDDAPGAIVRLLEMGMEPWLVGRTVKGVIACRLAVKTCQDCKEEYTPSAEALEFLGMQDMVGKMTFYHGKGCEKCSGTGHRGRVQMHEILEIGKDLSKMICRGETDPDILFRQAVQDGFKPMVEDARRFVLEGTVTPEEIYRILACR